MDWASYFKILLGAVIGAIVVTLADYLSKKGKVELNEYNLKLFYRQFYQSNLVINLNLDLQFINSSGYQQIIKNISARFFDGENFVPLLFENYNTRPADIIEAKKVKCLQYNITLTKIDIELPMLNIYEDKAYLEVTYNIKNKNLIKLIYGTEMQLIDNTRTYGDAKY